MTDLADPSADGSGGQRSPRRRFSPRRFGVLVVILSFVGIWGYVMYLTIFEGRAEPRDRLDDTAWAATAEAVCARSTPVFEALPFASEVGSPEERADILDAGTEELETMIARLESLEPPATQDEAAAVEAWLADYRTFVSDRQAYAIAQRDASDPRYDQAFSVTDREGYQIDVLIDDFAHVNYMDSCETPDDVG
ncbi:hypothetical protein [Actinospongicola halichondriae]|uniref:hypothetical protein n=1 Tax=Actinospongicola halichondriae TaxID=3236844 RepID=UPI003D549D4F